MKSFNWEGYYATGIGIVDDQHRRLVDLINELGDLLSSNGVRGADIERLLSELTRYAQEHFRDEEGLMRNLGVDPRHVESHVAVHRAFLNEVLSIGQGPASLDEETGRYLLDFLANWLAYHILGVDQNMSRQIRSIESGIAPAAAYDREEREADSGTRALLTALDNLFEQVSSRNKRLVELNQTLEDKVRARTRELHDSNRKLEVLSLTDSLTGLANRRHAIQQLSVLWQEAVESDGPLSCIMVDADHFKQVNDTYGHDAGDRLLRELGRALSLCVRSDDLTARLGGDEFLVICPATDQEGGLLLAHQVHRVVAGLSVSLGTGSWKGSISAGVAARSQGMQSYQDLIKLADRAVYAAKRDGRNCVRPA